MTMTADSVPSRDRLRAALARCRFLVLLCALMTPYSAQALSPAVLFATADVEGDGSARLALDGARSFGRMRGIEVAILGPPAGEDIDASAARDLVTGAIEAGHDIVVGVGPVFAESFRQLAPEHQAVRFVLVDAVVDLGNVESIEFNVEQGSFLVGALAAMASKTGKVGFVGGRDGALARTFACAFFEGARRLNPRIEVVSAMAGDTDPALADPGKGTELVRTLAEGGVDVVYHAAGASGDGIIAAAARQGILAIGAGGNQNGLAPGHVLTSMIKRLDVAVFAALSDIADGAWQPGTRRLGLRDGGVDWALDRHNVLLIDDDMQRRIETLTFEAIRGKIEVAAYSSRGGCPDFDFGPLPGTD